MTAADWLVESWSGGEHHGNAPLVSPRGMHGNVDPCSALLTIAAVRLWLYFALASGSAHRQA